MPGRSQAFFINIKMAKQDINPYRILDSARKFKMSADHLSQMSAQYLCSEDQNENSLSVASSASAIVLYALSIELGLKSLIVLEKDNIYKEHDLKKLLNRLSEAQRDKIINELPEERFKAYLDSYLEENKRDFEDWRYYYEKPTTASSDFLKAFSEAIIKVGESL